MRNVSAATRCTLSHQPDGRSRVHFAVIAVNSIVYAATVPRAIAGVRSNADRPGTSAPSQPTFAYRSTASSTPWIAEEAEGEHRKQLVPREDLLRLAPGGGVAWVTEDQAGRDLEGEQQVRHHAEGPSRDPRAQLGGPRVRRGKDLVGDADGDERGDRTDAHQRGDAHAHARPSRRGSRCPAPGAGGAHPRVVHRRSPKQHPLLFRGMVRRKGFTRREPMVHPRVGTQVLPRGGCPRPAVERGSSRSGVGDAGSSPARQPPMRRRLAAANSSSVRIPSAFSSPSRLSCSARMAPMPRGRPRPVPGDRVLTRARRPACRRPGVRPGRPPPAPRTGRPCRGTAPG